MKRSVLFSLLIVSVASVCYRFIYVPCGGNSQSTLHANTTVAPEQDGQGINSLIMSGWARVEKQILSELGDDYSINSYSNSETFTEILDSGNDFLWNSMMFESELPVMQVAGFLCVCQKRPTDRITAGLCILASAERPASPVYAPIYHEFERVEWQCSDYTTLNNVFRMRQSRPENLAILMQLVPVRIVAKWLQAGDIKSVSTTAMAAALDSVLGDCRGDINTCGGHLDQLGLSSQKVRKLLDAIAIGSDHSGLVYLMYASDTENLYADVLKRVLGSPDLSAIEIAFLVERRTKSIGKYLEALREDIPKERLTLIEKIINNGE